MKFPSHSPEKQALTKHSRLGWLTSMIACLCLALPSASTAQENEPGAGQAPDMEQILRNAKPAPNPRGKDYTDIQSLSPDHLDWIGYDPATGEEVIHPADTDRLQNLLPRDESNEGFPYPPLSSSIRKKAVMMA